MISMNSNTSMPAGDTAATSKSIRRPDKFGNEPQEKAAGFDALLDLKDARNVQNADVTESGEAPFPETGEDSEPETVDASDATIAVPVMDQSPLPNAAWSHETNSPASVSASPPQQQERPAPQQTFFAAISALKLQPHRDMNKPEPGTATLTKIEKAAGDLASDPNPLIQSTEGTTARQSASAAEGTRASKNEKPNNAFRDTIVDVQEQARPSASSVQTTLTPQLPAQPASVAASRTTETQPSFRPHVTDVQIISERSFGVAKTLHIRLEPVELGTVMARMRIVPEGMQIELTADRRETAELLARDKEALGRALHLAGLGDDRIVAVSIADRNATANQAGNQTFSGQDQSLGRDAHQSSTGAQDQHRSGGKAATQNTYPDNLTDAGDVETPKLASNRSSARGLII